MHRIAGLFVPRGDSRPDVAPLKASSRTGLETGDAPVFPHDCQFSNGARSLGAAGDVSRFVDHSQDLEQIEVSGAIIDRENQTLHLFRAPAGDNPLFYWQDGSSVAFADSPSALFPLNGGAPDFEGLALDRSGHAQSTRTAFAGISRVLPGEHLTFGSGGLVKRRRVPPLAIDEWGSDWGQKEVDEGRILLDAAVARHLPTNGLIASHLSSGRDSSAVTATAARLAPERVIAFTGAPTEGAPTGSQRGRHADERIDAMALAAELRVPQHTVRSTGTLFDLLAAVVRTFQTALYPASNLSWLLGIADRARASGATTMLVGGLGNITLNAGGLPVLQDYWRAGRWSRFASELRSSTARSDVRLRGALAAAFGPWLPAPAMRALGTLFADYAYPDPDRFVRRHWRRRRPADLDSYPRRKDWRASFAQDFHDHDPGLRRLGMEIGFGLRERDPFADRALAQFLFRLPPSAFLKDGVFRPFANALLSDRLPQHLLEARRRGLQGADWLARFDTSQAMEIVEEARASTFATEFLDLDQVEIEIGELSRRRGASFGKQIDYGWHLMEALTLAVFLTELQHHGNAWATGPMVLS